MQIGIVRSTWRLSMSSATLEKCVSQKEKDGGLRFRYPSMPPTQYLAAMLRITSELLLVLSFQARFSSRAVRMAAPFGGQGLAYMAGAGAIAKNCTGV